MAISDNSDSEILERVRQRPRSLLRRSYTLRDLIRATGLDPLTLKALESDGVFVAPRDAYSSRRWQPDAFIAAVRAIQRHLNGQSNDD